METKPNPGSAEAIALSCTCPVLDNNHGAGFRATFHIAPDERSFSVDFNAKHPQSGDLFWVNGDCPLHGTKDTTFSVDGIVHHVGDIACPECFGDWPKRCACGGLVHREQCSDADDAGGDSWVEFFDILRCDKCDDLRI